MPIRRLYYQIIALFAVAALGTVWFVFYSLDRYYTDQLAAQATAFIRILGEDPSFKKDWMSPAGDDQKFKQLNVRLDDLLALGKGGSEPGPAEAKVLRINIFDAERMVVWSSDQTLTGKISDGNGLLNRALAGNAQYKWGRFLGPDHREEEILEIYVPHPEESSGKVAGVTEVYLSAGGLKSTIGRAQAAAAAIALAIMVLIYLVLSRLFGGVSKRLDLQSAELAAFQETQEKVYLDIIKSLAAAIDAKDPYTRGHSGRVARNAVMLARALYLPTAEQKILEQAAILHDVGKIGITDSILNKPDKLTAEEWDQMKAHPEIGALIISPAESIDPKVVTMIRHHHERFDGRGYPSGILNGDIPLGARIIAVADAYDAMRSDRPYRIARTPEESLSEIVNGAGAQFDPAVVKAFLAVRDTIESLYMLEEGQRRSTA